MPGEHLQGAWCLVWLWHSEWRAQVLGQGRGLWHSEWRAQVFGQGRGLWHVLEPRCARFLIARRARGEHPHLPLPLLVGPGGVTP